MALHLQSNRTTILVSCDDVGPIQIICIAVFTLACGAMFYALFGYPLLLDWMAKHSHNPVQKDDKLRTVSFVIAVYNAKSFWSAS